MPAQALMGPLASTTAALCLALPAAAQGEPSLFLDLSIDAALERAEQENKLLMIAWTKSFETECRRLEETTWRDAGVRAWLHERTVPIQVSWDDDMALPARFGVKIYPTCLFVRADGVEAGRMAGYYSPEEFVRHAEIELSGRTGGAALPEGERANDPLAWIAYANAIYKAPGLSDEACAAYLWALDHGEEHMPGFRAKHFDFLVQRIASLKKRSSMAEDALTQRRDSVARSITSGEAPLEAVPELITFNLWLRRDMRSLQTFDSLKGAEGHRADLRAALFLEITELLAAHRRYDDITAEGGDILARMSTKLAALQVDLAAVPGDDSADLERIAELTRRKKAVVTEGAAFYEALLATGQGEDAGALLDMLVTTLPTGHVYALLITKAGRLEFWEIVEQIAERGRANVTGSGLRRIENAYVNNVDPEKRKALQAERIKGDAKTPEHLRGAKRKLKRMQDKDKDDEQGKSGDDGEDGR